MISSDSKSYFLFCSRILFGAWLSYLGIAKWIGGASGFVGYISKTFAEAWPPEAMIVGMAWTILVAEVVCGLWLLTGIKARVAWSATALLLFSLVLGQTMLQHFDVVANNWQYVFFAILCASLSDPVLKGKG